ncbi:hypothetical protein WJX84_006601 [Apatococcus fuscideae]|uniref:tRNA-binding domain-containing protein n=1 Tax=Apatococcus fuscideae TaxID=2026836 RepID=A0AAW1TH79_9CHLO
MTDDQDRGASARKPAGKAKKGKVKKGKGRGWESDEDEPPAVLVDKEEVEEEEVQASAKSKRAGKPAAAASFALLNKDEAEAPGGNAEVPELLVARVLSLERLPKSDKLKKCKVSTGDGTLQVVTNAQNVAVGMHVILAPVGARVPSSGMLVEERPVMGAKSQGMLCSAFNIGWLDTEAGVLAELPQGSTLGEPCPEDPPEGTILGNESSMGRQASNSKAKAAAAAALENGELDSEPSAELESEAADALPTDKADGRLANGHAAAGKDNVEAESAAGKKKKSSNAKRADMGDIFAALEEGAAPAEPHGDKSQDPLEQPASNVAGVKSTDQMAVATANRHIEPPANSGKKGKKGKKGKPAPAPGDDDDIDALLAEIGEGPSARPAEPLAAESATQDDAAGEAGAEPSANAAAEPIEEAASSAKDKKKGRKKKGVKAAANEDDDLDKLLAEIEGRQGKAAPAEAVAPAAAAPDGAAPDAAANAEADGGNETADAEAESEGKAVGKPFLHPLRAVREEFEEANRCSKKHMARYGKKGTWFANNTQFSRGLHNSAVDIPLHKAAVVQATGALRIVCKPGPFLPISCHVLLATPVCLLEVLTDGPEGL